MRLVIYIYGLPVFFRFRSVTATCFQTCISNQLLSVHQFAFCINLLSGYFQCCLVIFSAF